MRRGHQQASRPAPARARFRPAPAPAPSDAPASPCSAPRRKCRRERQRRQVGQRVQAAVIPGRVAHRQVHAAVSLAREVVRVLSLARAGVQDPGAGGQRAAPSAATASSISASKCRMCRRSGLGKRYASPEYLIACAPPSSPCCPAPHAASASVNGSAAATSAKCARSLVSAPPRFPAPCGRGAPWGRAPARGCSPFSRRPPAAR